MYQRLLLTQLVRRKRQERGILCVDIKAQLQLRDGKGITGVIEHQNLSGIFFVPEQLPSADIGLVNILGVIDYADTAPGIGDGIEIIGVIRQIPKAFVNVLIIRNVRKVQRFEHILFNEFLYHVVRGNDNVKGGTAGLQLGVHTLVTVKGHIVDFNIRIRFFKCFDHVKAVVGAVGNILSPVVKIDRNRFVSKDGGGYGGQKKRGEEENRNQSFHLPALLFMSF